MSYATAFPQTAQPYGTYPPPQPQPLPLPKTKPPVPPRGWTGNGAANPLVGCALYLILIAFTLAFIALLTCHWIVHDEVTNFFPIGGVPLSPTPALPNGFQVATNEKRTLRMGIWKTCFYAGNLHDCVRTLSLVKGATDRDADDNDADFADQLEHVVRAVQALMIIGLVFLFFGMCAMLATLASGKNWKSFRMLRLVACCILFIAFACLFSAWMTWLLTTPKEHARSGTNQTLELKCDGCNWGYSFWFVMTAWILCLFAMCLLLVAGEPPMSLYPVRQAVQQTTIIAPPPPPVYTAPPSTPLALAPPPAEYMYVSEPPMPPPIVVQEAPQPLSTTTNYVVGDNYISSPQLGTTMTMM